LVKDTLQGKRIAVLRRTFIPGHSQALKQAHPYIFEVFDESVKTIESLGAVTVQANMSSIDEMLLSGEEDLVCEIDFKIQMNEYFTSLISNPSGVQSVADLIKFNEDHPELEMPPGLEDQTYLTMSESTSGPNSTYFDALRRYKELAAIQGIDAVLRDCNADAIVVPAFGTTTPSALAGYPIITVPSGFYPENTTIGYLGEGGLIYPAPGLPIGLSFLGTAFSEFELIGLAYAYEQATRTRFQRRAFEAAIPVTQLSDVMLPRGHSFEANNKVLRPLL